MGAGDPNCKVCHGEGYTWVYGEGPPYNKTCECRISRNLKTFLDHGWPGLSRATQIEATPLHMYRRRNLWVTAPLNVFRQHMRCVALQCGQTWSFKVYPDDDLPRAWLGDLKNHEIRDVELATMDAKANDLAELVDPPFMLVVWLGVKTLRMVTMPENLLEVLERRRFIDKPTWLFDDPKRPLQEGHIDYSPQVAEFLSSWDHIILEGDVFNESEEPSGYVDIPAQPAKPPPKRTRKADPSVVAKSKKASGATKKNGFNSGGIKRGGRKK